MPILPLQGLPPLPIPTDPQQLVNQIINQYGPALVSFAVTVAIFLVTFLVVYAIARIALVRLTKGALRSRGFGQEVRGLAGSVMAAIALFVALGVAATVAGFGVVLGAFATLLGALSLAVGFAMQDPLSNFVAGVFILRDEPFQIGDWTEWYGDTERTGVVRDIQLRVTKIETFDNELITVPNSELADSAVKNPVANEELRVPFTFGIGYEDDIDQARDIIIQEASTVDLFNGSDSDVIVTELAIRPWDSPLAGTSPIRTGASTSTPNRTGSKPLRTASTLKASICRIPIPNSPAPWTSPTPSGRKPPAPTTDPGVRFDDRSGSDADERAIGRSGGFTSSLRVRSYQHAFGIDDRPVLRFRVADEPTQTNGRAVRRTARDERCLVVPAAVRAVVAPSLVSVPVPVVAASTVPARTRFFSCERAFRRFVIEHARGVHRCAVGHLASGALGDDEVGQVNQSSFGRLHDLAKRLDLARRCERERVGEIVKRHEVTVVERPCPRSPQITHVRAGPERQPQVVTQLSHVGPAFTTDPQECSARLAVEYLQPVDLSHPQATGNGALAWRFLIDRPDELSYHCLEVLGETFVNFEDRDVLLRGK